MSRIDRIREVVEYATESRDTYDLETHLPMTDDYDDGVHYFIKLLENAKDNDDEYKLTVEDLIDFYNMNYENYTDFFE